MHKKILSSLMITFFFSFASIFAGNENVLIVHDVEAEAGSTITIELEIQNDDDVIGFNCDIPLPEGFSLVEGSGEHFRTTDHQLSLSVIDDNIARFMLFSMSNSFLEGNEGVVTTFEVETPDTPGTYTLDITGTPVIGTIIDGEVTNVITGTESGDVTLTGEEFTLTINVVGEGGVNVDGTPYTEPVMIEEGSEVTLNAIAEDDWRFDEWSGDLTGSTTELEFTMDEDKEIQAIFTEMEQNIMKVRNVTAFTEDLAWIELEIINELDFVGFNADIVLPEGFTYVDGSEELLRDVDHLMEFNIIDDNTARMISFSPGVTPYTGNDGVIVRFMVETPQTPGDYPLTLENAMIGDDEAEDILTETVDGTITLEDDDVIENILLVRDVTASAGDIITIELEIINDQDFAGFNTDVVLPSGFTFIEDSEELHRSVDHDMVFNIIEDEEGTKARMIAFSVNLTPFSGNDGTIVSFDLQSPETPGSFPIPPDDAVIGAPDGEDILTGTEDGTITLLEPFTLTLIPEPEDGGTVEGSGDYEAGETIDISAEANEGWTFVNWTGAYTENLEDDEADETTLTMPADDVELMANFEMNDYELTINIMGEGEVGVNPEQEFYNIDDEITLTPVAEEGWEFEGWSGDTQYLDGNMLTMPADNVELTATFVLTEFTVSFMVMDEEELPLQGALVTINGEELFTNENGEADFQLFLGNYDYTVELECLLTADGAINVSDDLEVTVIMEGLPGDANGDGAVNVLDVLAIANYYATGDADPFCFENADINNDGVINVVDLLLVSNMFADKKMMMHHDLHSEDAHLYLGPGGISLKSDGTLAGLQFELKGSNLASLAPNLELADHQIIYGYDEEVFRAIIFNLNNEPIPEGNIEIVTFDDHAENLSWYDALAGNLIADEVPVHTHTGEVTNIEDITNTIDYSVFPNPAENVFWVSINNQSNLPVSLSLVNIQGQTIQTSVTDEKGHSEVEFNVHDLPAGMYIINIQYKDQTVMDKIMLK